MKKCLKLVALMLSAIFIITSCSGSSKGSEAEAGEVTDSNIAVESNDWAKENKIDVGDQTTEELYELAKEEGTVVIYSISSRMTHVKESFEAEYPGITVEVYDISTNELLEKVTREYESGIRNVDVIHCKDMDGSIYEEKVIPGIFHNYYPDDIISHIDAEHREYAMPMYIELHQWFYNTEVYDEPPVTSWWELTEPEWSGKLLTQNPLDNNNILAGFVTLIQHADDLEKDYEELYGEPLVLSEGAPTAGHELLLRLAANDLIFTSSSDEAVEAVGTPGQTDPPLGYAASSKIRKNETEGWVLEPILITPSTGVINMNNLYILNEAPHPNAAKLLVRWIVGEADGKGAGFDPFNTQGGWPVRDDVEGNPGNTPLEDVLLYTFDSNYVYQNMQEVSDFWIKIIG